MSAERKLTVVLAGDATSLNRTLDTTKGKVGSFGSKVSGLSTTAKVAFAGVGAAVVKFGGDSIGQFVEAQTAQSKLQDAFAKFPQLAGGNISALRDLNTQLALKTRFDDDATASGQAVLAQFGLTQDQLTSITPLLQDYAAKTGKDLPTAARDLGKAVLGQSRALKGIGINFKDTGDKAGNLEELMGGLNDKVGGFATKEGATAAGKAAILKNQFGELEEKVGGALVPVLSKLADIIITRVIPTAERFGAWIANNKPALIALGVLIGGTIVAAIAAFVAGLSTVALIAAGVVAGVAALTAGVVWAYQNWGFFRTAVDAVASFLTTKLWPALKTVASFITGTVIPIVMRVIGVYAAFYAKVAEVAVGVVKKVVEIGAGIARFVSDAKAKFDGIVSFIAGLPGRIASAASGMFDGIKNAFRSAVNWIIDKWNGLSFGVDKGPIHFHLDTPNIPRLASGGIVTRPTLALIGEAGPEAVVPLGRGGMGGGTSVTLDLRGAIITSDIQFERIVRRALQDSVRREGKIPGTNIVRAS